MEAYKGIPPFKIGETRTAKPIMSHGKYDEHYTKSDHWDAKMRHNIHAAKIKADKGPPQLSEHHMKQYEHHRKESQI